MRLNQLSKQFCHSDWLTLLNDWQIVWDPKQTNFFGSQMFMQYWMYADPTNEKTGDNLLGSASYANNFCWIWFILKHPYSRMLFTFGLMRINPRFITCHDVIDVFRSFAIVFLEHFFRPIQREQICLTVKCSYNIDCMPVPLTPKVVSISR